MKFPTNFLLRHRESKNCKPTMILQRDARRDIPTYARVISIQKVWSYRVLSWVELLYIRCRNGDNSSKSTCNFDCSCDIERFEPVCGADGLTYFSPCYAGCHNSLGDTVSYLSILYYYCHVMKLNMLMSAVFRYYRSRI